VGCGRARRGLTSRDPEPTPNLQLRVRVSSWKLGDGELGDGSWELGAGSSWVRGVIVVIVVTEPSSPHPSVQVRPSHHHQQPAPHTTSISTSREPAPEPATSNEQRTKSNQQPAPAPATAGKVASSSQSVVPHHPLSTTSNHHHLPPRLFFLLSPSLPRSLSSFTSHHLLPPLSCPPPSNPSSILHAPPSLARLLVVSRHARSHSTHVLNPSAVSSCASSQSSTRHSPAHPKDALSHRPPRPLAAPLRIHTLLTFVPSLVSPGASSPSPPPLQDPAS
jgi:hypothetical protein